MGMHYSGDDAALRSLIFGSLFGGTDLNFRIRGETSRAAARMSIFKPGTNCRYSSLSSFMAWHARHLRTKGRPGELETRDGWETLNQ